MPTAQKLKSQKKKELEGYRTLWHLVYIETKKTSIKFNTSNVKVSDE